MSSQDRYLEFYDECSEKVGDYADFDIFIKLIKR